MKKQFGFLLSATMIASLMLSATACSKAPADNKSSGTLGDATESSGASESTSENTADAKDSSSTADTSQTASANSESSDNTEDAASEQNSSDSSDSVKIPASEADLLEFMEGDWSLVNPVTKTDYATISFQNDGSFSYEYTGSGDKCEGSLGANHLYSGEDKLPLSFTINVSGIDKMNFDRDHYYVPEDGKDTSDCKIYIGNCDGDDYMYMESTGNGDSFITTVLFQDQTNVDGSFYMGSQAVLMHRKREIAVEPDAKEIFYGWLWKADDEGFWAQEMIPLTWDDENEYTGTRFTAAAFEPVCIGSAFYEYTDKVNKNLLLNSQRLDMTYPRLMCRITLDENGELEDLEEVDQAFYGIYNVGDREDDVSYDFMTFTWNGIDYDLSETSPGSHILDVRSAYGKKIVECHISPHTSAYHIFDTFYGQFTETPIEGTGLIWLDDDFSTAIYAQWNEVRDLCGDLMFTVDGDEILDLEFLDDGKKVKCQYLKVDADETKEEIFELPERRDHAMCAFCDYAVSGKASDYKKFMEYVPDDAAFFVVTDPQTWFTETQIISDAVEPNGSNKVMIVALHDNTTLEIVDDKGKGIDPLVMDRGQYYIFSMTVSETMPLYTVKVTIDNPEKKLAAEWPVAEFSGETYQHCKFITESGDATPHRTSSSLPAYPLHSLRNRPIQHKHDHEITRAVYEVPRNTRCPPDEG
ncbi:hypothetical protein [Butyrivibrio sp. FC2001]|uniref:hypothetical protein n=1 Tax=Butyrivibrio sp. FC2001 TaxID=1280671 RepID=UPI00041823FE|nr:hypothetical protein [Butyrivibrio sp. FC2001]